MPSDTVLYEVKDRIAHITLNRPEVMNSLSRELLARYREILSEFEDNPEPLVAIVRGAGDKAFSSGMDLKERASKDKTEGPQRKSRPTPPIQEVWKPMIAAINGYCVAGGLEIALQCDIRIATPKSQFGLPEPRWSLTAGPGLHHLNRMIPLGEALYIQLTGERINAERAYQIGLIQKLVPEDKLGEEAEKVARSVLMCAPLAIRAIKKTVMIGRNLPVEYSWRYANEMASTLNRTEDALEGPRAFAEKRKPNWKGK